MNEERAAKERPNVGKEIKIGISVVVVLLGVFGYVLYTKFFKADPGPQVAAKAPVPAEVKAKAKLASGPAQPTVVAPQPDSSTPATSSSGLSTSRSSRNSNPSSSGNLSVPNSQPSSPTTAGNPEGRYRDRYGSGPPSYDYASSGAAATSDSSSARPSTMPTDPYAYTATPASTSPADPYALDEPAGTSDVASQGRVPARLGPAAGSESGQAVPSDPNRPASNTTSSRTTSAPRDPYGRSTSRTHAQAVAAPEPDAEPAAPAATYSSARSYEMYGRTASGAPATPPPATSSRPNSATRPPATSVAFGNSSSQGEIERSTDEYTVEPNDSYWTISKKLYGNGAYFNALFEHNRQHIPRPDQLKPGMTIAAPSTAALRQTYPDLCPSEEHAAVAEQTSLVSTGGSSLASGANIYVVEEGDTLFDIARFELGRASRWAEIYDLNRDQIGKNMDYLRPGTELMLPPDHSDTSFTRRQEPTRQR